LTGYHNYIYVQDISGTLIYFEPFVRFFIDISYELFHILFFNLRFVFLKILTSAENSYINQYNISFISAEIQ
jgi:hypothetical protein